MLRSRRRTGCRQHLGEHICHANDSTDRRPRTGGTALLPLASTSAAEARCHGKPATIPDAVTIVGTPGADVIITSKAERVDARGGDDLICLVDGERMINLIDIDAGDGDDVVDLSARHQVDNAEVVLGAGSDRFIGGRAEETVWAGRMVESSHRDTEPDRIDTAAGDDHVVTGQPGEPNSDTVRTGRGWDHITASGQFTAQAMLDSGPGEDTFAWGIGAGQHVLDLGREQLTTNGSPQALPAGFDLYEVDGTADAVGHLDLLGSDQADDVEIDLDLGRGQLSVDDATVPTTRFEDATVFARSVLLRGSNRRNDLSAGGCQVRIVGRDAADTLAAIEDYVWEYYGWVDCTEYSSVLVGGRGADLLLGDLGHDVLHGGSGHDRLQGDDGNDVLYGGPHNDRLYGGTGRDLTHGGAGHDLCRGETLRACETR